MNRSDSAQLCSAQAQVGDKWMLFSGDAKTEDTEGDYNLCFCAAFQPGGSQTSSQSEEIRTSAAASTCSCSQEPSAAVADKRNRDLYQYYTGN